MLIIYSLQCLVREKSWCSVFSLDGEKVKNEQLALACIAQIRYLDVVYDPKQLFAAVFEQDIEHWSPKVRDTLIQALPEILLNAGVQQGSCWIKFASLNSF